MRKEVQAMARQDDEYQWFTENREQLFNQLGDQYVAVFGHKVIAHASDFMETFMDAAKTAKPGEFIVQRLSKEPIVEQYVNHAVAF